MLSEINSGIHEPVVLTQFELFVLGGGHGSVDSQQPQHHVHRRRHRRTDRWAPRRPPRPCKMLVLKTAVLDC